MTEIAFTLTGRASPETVRKVFAEMQRLVPDFEVVGDRSVNEIAKLARHDVEKRRTPIPRSTTIPWVRGTGLAEGTAVARHDGLLYKLSGGGRAGQGFDLRIIHESGPSLFAIPEFNPNTAGSEWFSHKADALAAAQAVCNARAAENKAAFLG